MVHMKRSELVPGKAYAYRTSKYGKTAVVTVVSTDVLVSSRSANFSRKPAPTNTITLSDGTTATGKFRIPESYDSAADKGVLVRGDTRTWVGADDGSDHSNDLSVVPPRYLVGEADAVLEADARAKAAEEAQYKREREEAAERRAFEQAVNERVVALLGDGDPGIRFDYGFTYRLSVERATLVALLDLAEGKA